MKLSTRARYGTRALLDLALHREEEPVQLKDIAFRQEVSLHYLEHLISPLISAGVIRSIRGARGGIKLARQPYQIRLSEVIQLLEGSISPVECLDNPKVCNRSSACATRDVWSDMKKAMHAVLESTTLQDLVDRQRDKEQSKQPMYYV
ncbi:MAG: Rrf2 family transcriptional regulator [Dehalococcoidales bacterium]|nr:Rrf2 family transcriptional regulator [Dehalococcoidales bacterium]